MYRDVFQQRLKMAASLLPRSRLTKHVMKLLPCSQGPRFTPTGGVVLEVFVEKSYNYISSIQCFVIWLESFKRSHRVLESNGAFPR
jgi:peptidase E